MFKLKKRLLENNVPLNKSNQLTVKKKRKRVLGLKKYRR